MSMSDRKLVLVTGVVEEAGRLAGHGSQVRRAR